MNLHQGKNETVEVFGARVNEMLNSGLETARDAYNTEQVVGVNDLLRNTAIISFIKGLWNEPARFYLNRLKDNKNWPDLETAIIRKIESVRIGWLFEAPSSSKSFVTNVTYFEQT